MGKPQKIIEEVDSVERISFASLKLKRKIKKAKNSTATQFMLT